MGNEIEILSELIDKFQYSFEWLEYTKPGMTDCYNPGLTCQKIGKTVKDLPFQLSEEIYELYQWRNGFAFDNNLTSNMFLFPDRLGNDVPITFCSLQDSVYIYNIMRPVSEADTNPSSEYEYWNSKWFPIGEYEGKKILYVVGDLDPSPVHLWNVDYTNNNNLVRVYKNLTSMISVIAECCESELYQVIPCEYGEEDEMVIRIDERKLELERAIYRKYHS